MAISATVLTSSSSTNNATTYTTASISPASGRVLLAFVSMAGIGAATASTISGLSGTWTNHTGSNRPAALTSYDLAVFTCTNYSGSGTLTLGNTDSATSCCWSIVEVNGADTTTPVVASAIKKVSLGSVSTGSITLDSPAAADNRPFAAFVCDNNTAAQAAPRTNWTELADVAVSTPGQVLQVQWRSDAHETTASVTYTDGPYSAGGVAIEIAVASSGTTVPGSADASLGTLTATAAGVADHPGTVVASSALTATATGLREATGVVSLDLGVFTATVAVATVDHPGVLTAAVGVTATATATTERFAVADGSLGVLSATAAGGELVSGTAAADIGVTATVSGLVERLGVLDGALGSLTANAAAAPERFGTATVSLGSLTATAVGTPDVRGVVAASLGGLTVTAIGTPTVVGTVTASLGGLTATATAWVALSGTASADLGSLTASGATIPTGQAQANLGGLTGTAAGLREILGAAAVTIGLTGTVTGLREVSGTAASALGDLTATAGGTPETPQNGAQAALGALTATVTGVRQVSGTAVASLLGTFVITGAPGRFGTALASFDGSTATAVGVPDRPGAATADLGGLVATATGDTIAATTGLASASLGALEAEIIGLPLRAGAAVAAIGFVGVAVAFVHAGYPELFAGRPTVLGVAGAGTPVVTAPSGGRPTVVPGTHAGTPALV